MRLVGIMALRSALAASERARQGEREFRNSMK
jgi:hypothetical protein